MQFEFIATLNWVKTALQDKDKRQYWQKWQAELEKPSELLSSFTFSADPIMVGSLPPFSFALRVPFKLQKSYISKDDCAFHLWDNPIRKDKVFKTPMVAATGWKGALRAALWQLGYKEDHEVTIRLLGNPRESDEHQAGRLYFFPTFFDKVALEVINPHDRETGVSARGPIFMECVPAETEGAFTLLYVPFGPIEQSEDERRAQVAQDLEVVVKGIQAMLTTYGFGAKTSSGFGTANNKLVKEGSLAIRASLDMIEETGNGRGQKDLPPGITKEQLQDYLREDGSLRTLGEYRDLMKSRGQKWGKRSEKRFNAVKDWLEQREKRTREAAKLQEAGITQLSFSTLADLVARAEEAAKALQEGGDER